MLRHGRSLFALCTLVLLFTSCKAATKPVSADDVDLTPPIHHDAVLIATSDSLGDWSCGGFLMQQCPVQSCSEVLHNGTFKISTWGGQAMCCGVGTSSTRSYVNDDSVWATGIVRIEVEGKASYGCFGRYRVTNSLTYGQDFYFRGDVQADTSLALPFRIALDPQSEPRAQFSSFLLAMYCVVDEHDYSSRVSVAVDSLRIWAIHL